MHYKHSNGEVGTIDETTGKRSVWKVCDICGAQQRSNNGFTVSYQMPGAWGAETHGYCNKCARKLIPILTAALDEIEKQERERRQTVPRGKQYIDPAKVMQAAERELYAEE